MTGPARQGKDKRVKQVIKYYNRCPIGTFSRGNLIDKILIIILVSLESGAKARYSSLANNDSKT